MSATHGIPVPIAPGELIDKLTILEIKRARITDCQRLANVEHEYRLLQEVCRRHVEDGPEIAALRESLAATNERLWEIEDAIRECERRGEFGAEFVELARSVYRQNDQRAALKRAINLQLGSPIIEEKSYASY